MRQRALGPPDAGGNRPRRRPDRRHHHTPAIYRRRRVLAALVLLNAVELVGVLVVGPGFWISFAVTATLLIVYVVHLRARAVADRRRRRALAREERRLGLLPPCRRPAWPPLRGRPRLKQRLTPPRAHALDGRGDRFGESAGSGRTKAALSGKLRDRARRGWAGWFAAAALDLLALSPARPVTAGWDRRRLAGGGAVAQTGSAPRSHRGGQGFKSPQLHPVRRPFPVVGDGLFRSCAQRRSPP